MHRDDAVNLLVASAFVLLGAARAPAQTAEEKRVDVYVTAKDTGDRLAKKPSVALVPLPQPDEANPTILVDTSKTFQTFEGIGGALTDAAAETFAKLPPERQKEVLTAYFDPAKGIGYSLGRTHIHSCDFSSESYAYTETAGDVDLQHFTIEHDRKYKIPFIKAALATAGGVLKLFASPWSPPAWMKTNGDMLHGGTLKPEYRSAWARYFVRFVQEYEKEGIPIWGLTVQNEPMATQTWESCIFTGDEERDFVRDYLGPTLESAGLARLKLMIWDHNRGILYQRAKAVFDDPKASRYVWGAGFHWYVGDHWDNVRVTHEAWPDKALLFTEGTPANFDPATIDDWKWGETYGESMIRDVNNWAVGWTDWNVLLDERGGPNHVGNFCFAPIHGDTRTGQLHYMSSYWYLGHLSKFIRPGARRVASTSNDDTLLATAFKNRDGRLAVVVMNKSEKTVPFQLWIEGRTARTTSPARSIVTLVY
jgi:glucosylceramidase